MRKYLFGTGLVTAISGGLTLLRSLREDAPFTWRTALGWLSWAISVALVIGAIVDVRRASKGQTIDPDSPVHGQEDKLMKDRARRILTIVTGLDYDAADALLKRAKWNVKAAIVMQKTSLTLPQALRRLRKADDSIREAIGEDVEPRLRDLLKGA